MSHSRPIRERPELLAAYPTPCPIIVVVESREGNARLRVDIPVTKDPFEVLAHAQNHVLAMDSGRETGENSSNPGGAALHRPSRAEGRPLPLPQGASAPARDARPNAQHSPLGPVSETKESPPTGGTDELFSSPATAPVTSGAGTSRQAAANRDNSWRPESSGVRPETTNDALRDTAPSPGRGQGQRPSEPGKPETRRTTTGVRDTSMMAYRALEWSGKMSDAQQTVVNRFLAEPWHSWTRQELARDVIWKGAPMPINSVCGRVKELIEMGVLEELSVRKRCTVTGNEVNAVALVSYNPLLKEGTES